MVRKGVLFVRDDEVCVKAKELLRESGIEFVEYNVSEEREGCCGGFDTVTPTLFAPEGIFRGIDGISRYIELRRSNSFYKSESAHW